MSMVKYQAVSCCLYFLMAQVMPTKTSKTTFNNDQPRSAKSLVLCLETDLFTFQFLETNQQ